MAATTSRTLELLSLLQSHRHWSARELTDRLGVSDRTLRRDVDRLRGLGYSVEALRGSIGGYRLEAGTGLPPLLLSDDEGVAIAIGLRSQATGGLRGAEHTTISALAKIEQVLPPALRRRIEALQSHAVTAPGQGPAVDPELLGLLALCCRDSERLRLRYTDAAGRASIRSIEPHRLVPIARRWYLLAWDRDREDWRTFRVDRVDDVFQTRVRFPPRAMSEDEARERVERSVQRREPQLVARVEIDRPVAEVRSVLGWWARDATALPGDRTVWTIEARSIEEVATGLLWLPAEWASRLDAAPEVLAFLGRLGARYSALSAQ